MALMGLMTRREIWMPTRRGLVLTGVLVLLFGFLASRYTYRFLAIHQPVDSSVYVIEGWLSKRALRQMVEQLQMDGYDLVLTTGGPFSKQSYLADLYPLFTTYAEIAAHVLKHEGIDPNKLVVISASAVQRDRTYHSTVFLRNWLEAEAPDVKALNVVTRGPHARRTRLLFERGLGADFEVGVIPITEPNYDPERWWVSSAGVKRVMTEAFAYLYAKFFFFPEEPIRG